jgi:cytochrome P450
MIEPFDLYSPEIDADPFRYYEILREQHPCYWSESGKLWIISRYHDIVEACRDWETFSSSQGNMIDEIPGRAGNKSVKGRNAQHIAAFKELSDFLTEEVAARRKQPTDDLITHLAEAEIDGDKLSEREVVLTTATFVMVGVESLSSFMSMLALNLHDYPDARRRVVTDPKLMAATIEESLRFNTSAQRFKRTVMREKQLHGQTLSRRDCLEFVSNFRSPVALPFARG